MSSMRAARLPPMNVFDEPVLSWKNGAMPTHVGARPMSPQRAAGMLLINTRTLVPSITAPSDGNGTGGAGGIKLGGWLCVCGTPTYIIVIDAAGRLGNTAASGAVKFAKPAFTMSPTAPIAPSAEPTTPWIARAVATACCDFDCGLS